MIFNKEELSTLKDFAILDLMFSAKDKDNVIEQVEFFESLSPENLYLELKKSKGSAYLIETVFELNKGKFVEEEISEGSLDGLSDFLFSWAKSLLRRPVDDPNIIAEALQRITDGIDTVDKVKDLLSQAIKKESNSTFKKQMLSDYDNMLTYSSYLKNKLVDFNRNGTKSYQFVDTTTLMGVIKYYILLFYYWIKLLFFVYGGITVTFAVVVGLFFGATTLLGVGFLSAPATSLAASVASTAYGMFGVFAGSFLIIMTISKVMEYVYYTFQRKIVGKKVFTEGDLDDLRKANFLEKEQKELDIEKLKAIETLNKELGKKAGERVKTNIKTKSSKESIVIEELSRIQEGELELKELDLDKIEESINKFIELEKTKLIESDEDITNKIEGTKNKISILQKMKEKIKGFLSKERLNIVIQKLKNFLIELHNLYYGRKFAHYFAKDKELANAFKNYINNFKRYKKLKETELKAKLELAKYEDIPFGKTEEERKKYNEAQPMIRKLKALYEQRLEISKKAYDEFITSYDVIKVRLAEIRKKGEKVDPNVDKNLEKNFENKNKS